MKGRARSKVLNPKQPKHCL